MCAPPINSITILIRNRIVPTKAGTANHPALSLNRSSIMAAPPVVVRFRILPLDYSLETPRLLRCWAILPRDFTLRSVHPQGVVPHRRQAMKNDAPLMPDMDGC